MFKVPFPGCTNYTNMWSAAWTCLYESSLLAGVMGCLVPGRTVKVIPY